MRVTARPLWWLAVALAALLGVGLAIWLRDEVDVPETTMDDGATGWPFAADPVAETRRAAVPSTPGVRHAWSAADAAQAAPEWVPSQGPDVTGAVFVALDEAMSTWRAGDAVAIPVPQLGTTYPAVIDRIDSAFAGNHSYIGKLAAHVGQLDADVGILDADTRPFTFVITVGARNVFGYVGTPDGTYELVANRRFGWLMPTANMDAH